MIIEEKTMLKDEKNKCVTCLHLHVRLPISKLFCEVDRLEVLKKIELLGSKRQTRC